MSDSSSPTPTFIAPEVTEDTILEFSLTVSDGALSSSDSVKVLVKSMYGPSISFEKASSDTPIPIPDNDSKGIESKIEVKEKGYLIIGLEVGIKIAHPYIMDLKVVLRSPSGTESVLHNYEGGQGPGGIYKTYTLTDFNLEPLEGNWTLKVSDNWYYDTGVLEEWSLKFTAVKDPGQPENNPPVADAGLDQNVEEKT